MVFEHLFKITDEPPVDSGKYFVGNIALIEGQAAPALRILAGESGVEQLWLLHCEHKVAELTAAFKQEIERSRGSSKRLKCQKFVDHYHQQMNVYELETLLDVLCADGLFARFEEDAFESLLVRLAKNKVLFDAQWWRETSRLDWPRFVRDYAGFCAQRGLFMPLEMFVIATERARDVDLSDHEEPMVRFIWDLWIKRDPAAATLSCMQLMAKTNSNDLLTLWEKLPPESLGPLACFVWNKNPDMFKPESPELQTLSQRLQRNYPLLASLVKGEIPHPQGVVKEPPPSRWRAPLYTSKCDLELHDLICAQFQLDFGKVFTDHYGRTPGQPPFPHFTHPELVPSLAEPPYVHYVRSLLPVSAFSQAVDDGVGEGQFRQLCTQCLILALDDRQIRLAVLSFIELVDVRFGHGRATDFRLCVSIFDKLADKENQKLIGELVVIFDGHDREIAAQLQSRL